MTNEDYNRLKEKYNKLIEERELLTQLNQSLEKLEENKAKLELDLNVQAYVSILEQIADINRRLPSRKKQEFLTDAGIFSIISNQYISEENTNNIYVYIGAYGYDDYDIVHGSSIIQLPDDSSDYSWKTYKNIELSYWNASKEITKRELSQFESENTILYAPEGIDPEKFYIQIRTAFFEELMKAGQEQAIEKVLSIGHKQSK
ncbi:MAG: hypothetical protein J6K21_04155 [Bacilli bacterium]|nr:hypothetical protein [Bacilli bacterium]